MSDLHQHLEAVKQALLKQTNGNPFIDAQLLKQNFHVSDRTLARRREDGSLKAYSFGKKKFFYHIDNVMELFTPNFVMAVRKTGNWLQVVSYWLLVADYLL